MVRKELRITLDTCVWVNYFTNGGVKDEPWWLEHSKAMVGKAQAGDYRLVVPTLVVAEVFGAGDVRGDHLESQRRYEQVKKVREWLSGSQWLTVELHEGIARKAADLAVKYQLKGGDAVVLASALATESAALMSWDSDLLKLADRVPGLVVCQPSERASVLSRHSQQDSLEDSTETPIAWT